MKNKNIIIVILGMAAVALSTQPSKATIIELSMQQAAMIKGGDCSTCGAGKPGECDIVVKSCGNSELHQGAYGTGVCASTPAWYKRSAYTTCGGTTGKGCKNNAGAEGTGCGAKYIQHCQTDQTQGIAFGCIDDGDPKSSPGDMKDCKNK
jgi:hypothetical protein